MRVITINGQNHKGSTYHIGRMLAENSAMGMRLKKYSFHAIFLISALDAVSVF